MAKYRLLALAVAAMALSIPAHANPIFNITYTAAVQGNTNFASIQSAVNYVTSEFSTLYSDNITINFTVDQNSSGLGQSLFSNAYWRGTYSQLRTALINDAKSTDDATATALANLPATAPYADSCGGSIPDCWYATSAEAKALGLIAANGLASDGTFTFNSLQTYTYDPNNRGTGGFDFIGVTEHEFTELMGRTQQSNAFGYDILDTMRFTSVGTRNVDLSNTRPSNVYFSFDNGNTDLATYNPGGGDPQDLDGSVPTDPYNASTGSSQAHFLNSTDIRTMDVIGYDLATTVPEPGTLLLLGGGLLAIGRKLRRK